MEIIIALIAVGVLAGAHASNVLGGHPIKRGFLGRAGAERYLNVGCLMIVLVLVALGLLAMCSSLIR